MVKQQSMTVLNVMAMMIFLSTSLANQGFAFVPVSLSAWSSSSLSSAAKQLSSARPDGDDRMVYYDDTDIDTAAKCLSSPSSRRDVIYRSMSIVGALAGTVSMSAATPTTVSAMNEETAPIPRVASATGNKALSEEYRQGTAALADMNEQTAPVPREAYKKLSSGVIYADLIRPSGKSDEIVREGSKVNLQWVLRKSNGYFVDSSETNGSVPFIFTVGDGTAIAGVDEGVRYEYLLFLGFRLVSSFPTISGFLFETFSFYHIPNTLRLLT